MENILSKGCSPVLEQFVWSRVAVALDFDGTLAPIVADPTTVRLRSSTVERMRHLARLFPCAVISSRAASDLAPRLRNSGDWWLWAGGGHVAASVLGRVAEWRAALQEALRSCPGVEIEDKRSRLTVHYRRSREKRSVVQIVRDLAARFLGARVLNGNQVIHVQPLEVADKGQAIDEVLTELGCDTVLYVGDDGTDEDVFARDDTHRLLAVRVGESRTSQARYYVPDQDHVDVLLERIGKLREVLGRRPDPPRTKANRSARTGPHALLTSLRELDRQREVHSRAVEDSRGVTAQQQAVIRVVGQFPGISPGLVAETMRVDPSALTALLKPLVGDGLVASTVDPANKRRHRLGLTARGRKLDEPVAGTIEAAIARAFAHLRPEDVRAAQRVLKAVAQGFVQ